MNDAFGPDCAPCAELRADETPGSLGSARTLGSLTELLVTAGESPVTNEIWAHDGGCAHSGVRTRASRAGCRARSAEELPEVIAERRDGGTSQDAGMGRVSG